jgi:hypothetical protein
MLHPNLKHRLASAFVGAVAATALAVPGASAHHGSQPSEPPDVPPPPSSIAAPAGEAYSALRAPDGDGTNEGYVDLRSPDSRNQPDEYTATAVSPTVADEPSEGFDLVSAAIGALAAAGLAVVLVAALTMRRPASRHAASA